MTTPPPAAVTLTKTTTIVKEWIKASTLLRDGWTTTNERLVALTTQWLNSLQSLRMCESGIQLGSLLENPELTTKMRQTLKDDMQGLHNQLEATMEALHRLLCQYDGQVTRIQSYRDQCYVLVAQWCDSSTYLTHTSLPSSPTAPQPTLKNMQSTPVSTSSSSPFSFAASLPAILASTASSATSSSSSSSSSLTPIGAILSSVRVSRLLCEWSDPLMNMYECELNIKNKILQSIFHPSHCSLRSLTSPSHIYNDFGLDMYSPPPNISSGITIGTTTSSSAPSASQTTTSSPLSAIPTLSSSTHSSSSSSSAPSSSSFSSLSSLPSSSSPNNKTHAPPTGPDNVLTSCLGVVGTDIINTLCQEGWSGRGRGDEPPSHIMTLYITTLSLEPYINSNKISGWLNMAHNILKHELPID